MMLFDEFVEKNINLHLLRRVLLKDKGIKVSYFENNIRKINKLFKNVFRHGMIIWTQLLVHHLKYIKFCFHSTFLNIVKTEFIDLYYESTTL
jgi:hypothetical protein